MICSDSTHTTTVHKDQNCADSEEKSMTSKSGAAILLTMYQLKGDVVNLSLMSHIKGIQGCL